MNKLLRNAGVLAFALLVSVVSWAQVNDLSPEVVSQIQAISEAKAGLDAAQRKIGSRLVFGVMAGADDARVAKFKATLDALSAGTTVKVDIKGDVTEGLLSAIAAANGSVVYSAPQFGVVTASLPAGALEGIASRSDVSQIRTTARARTHVGKVTSQGYVSHQANSVVNGLSVTGAGVKVGVLSDSASAARIAALIASGDLPAGSAALPGEDGAPGSDEGTAMMEIVHDMAPGASLLFATAFTSPASFAQNIVALEAAGCKVIVDDVSWSDEGVFQDTVIAQAVNAVTANGVTYFSSAANSGSLTHGTSTTWEGDFLDGGAATAPLTGAGNVHNFGTVGSPQLFNRVLVAAGAVTLQWSDPFGGSANDYDLYVLNAAGTTIIAASANTQDGTQDPDEEIFAGLPANSRIVVVLFSGAQRALHLGTFGDAPLQIATSGATSGHNAGANTVSMAATNWNSAKNGTLPFTGGASNPTETFSSDGPRKVFYNPNGTAITAGNFLFGTNGGTTLTKPDLAAADGNSTLTPGFNPFFGTSSSAPHAAGIAALIMQARPTYTPAQVKTAMTATALDTMAPGVDRDSGYGLTMALPAVQYALTH